MEQITKSLVSFLVIKIVQKFKIVSLSYTCISHYLTFVHSRNFLKLNYILLISNLAPRKDGSFKVINIRTLTLLYVLYFFVVLAKLLQVSGFQTSYCSNTLIYSSCYRDSYPRNYFHCYSITVTNCNVNIYVFSWSEATLLKGS